MGFPVPRDISSLVNCKIADIAGPLVAGGGADGVEINGDSVNRDRYNSALLLVAVKGAITAAQTLTVAVQLQHADDNGAGAAGAYADLSASYAVTSVVVDNTTTEALMAVSIDLSEAKEWIRCQITPTFSAGATDTGEVAAVWVLGGAEVLPAEDSGVQRLPA